MDHNSSKRRHKPIQPPSPSSEDDAARKASVFRRLGNQRDVVIPHHNKPHIPPHAGASLRPECRHWMARGRCDFGSDCSFLHPPLPPPVQHNSPPKKYVRSPQQKQRQSQEFISGQEEMGRIRSAVVVSKSEHRSARKVTIPDEDPGKTDISRSSNYEFESALALEKERQYLQRRIDDLNKIAPDKPKNSSSRSRRDEPSPVNQQFVQASESDSESNPNLKVHSDYPDDHRSPYKKQKLALKSVGFPANRHFSQPIKGHFLRGRHHLDPNKEEGELSDDPEKREARREKMRQQEQEFKEAMKKQKREPPKTPPPLPADVEMESLSPNLRSANRSKNAYGSSERSKMKNSEEIPTGRQRSPSEQRRGVKRQHFEMIHDDDADQMRPPKMVTQRRPPPLDDEPAHRVRRPLPPPSANMKGGSTNRSMKQGPVRAMGMKRDHSFQDHFRRKYEFTNQRRFPVSQPIDQRRKILTRPVFEKRPEDQMERRRRKEFRPPTPPPMSPPHERAWQKSPTIRDSQVRSMDRRHMQRSPLKLERSPIKIGRQMDEERFDSQRYFAPKSPMREFPESNDLYEKIRRHRSKDGRSSKLVRSTNRKKDRSYPPSGEKSKSARKDEPEYKNSPPASTNEKFFESASPTQLTKKQEPACESVVEKISTPENIDEEGNNEKIADEVVAGGDQDLEPISDEEVQEEVEKVPGSAEGVDWSCLVKQTTTDETTSIKKSTESTETPTEFTSADRFKPEFFLVSLGLQKDLLGSELVSKIENVVSLSKENKNESMFRLVSGQDSNRSKLSSIQKRLQIINDVGPFRKALSARSDLKIRRQLCGLYAEPYENLNTTDFNVPFNANAYETAKNLFLKRPTVIDAQAL